MKTKAQVQKAIAQREANRVAKEAGEPMPYPNPWDTRSPLPKLPEGASHEAQMGWYAEFARRFAPH